MFTTKKASSSSSFLMQSTTAQRTYATAASIANFLAGQTTPTASMFSPRTQATRTTSASQPQPQSTLSQQSQQMYTLTNFARADALSGDKTTSLGAMLSNKHYSAESGEASCVELQRAGTGDCKHAEDQLVFYFEMSTRQGKRGYSSIARQVCSEELPGECENFASIGYATWRVPKSDYAKMLQTRTALQ